jgi:putative flippase GtrA
MLGTTRPKDEHTLSQRVSRYLSVSLVTASVGQIAIVLLHWIIGIGAVVSNASAALLVAAVGFVLSTRFVWSSDRSRRYRVEVPTFFAISLTGLAVSTGLVALVSQQTDMPITVNAASFISYGLVWVARFIILDRLVFVAVGQVFGPTAA